MDRIQQLIDGLNDIRPEDRNERMQEIQELMRREREQQDRDQEQRRREQQEERELIDQRMEGHRQEFLELRRLAHERDQDRFEEEPRQEPEMLGFEDLVMDQRPNPQDRGMLNFDDLDENRDRLDKDIESLKQAIEFGDIDKVEALVRGGASLNWTDEYGMTSLLYGIDTGDIKMIEALVRLGADVNYGDKDYGSTALMYAAKRSTVSIVEALVRLGADVNGRDTEYGQTVLMYGVQGKMIDVVEALVRLGADVNGRDTEYGKTVLMYAVGRQNVKMVEALVRLGADVNGRDDESITPLMVCIIECYDMDKEEVMDNIPMVDALIKLGADVNAQSDTGLTALIAATRASEIVQQVNMLLQAGAGATINAQTEGGDTALIRFVTSDLDLHLDEYLFMISLLVEHGADINLQDEEGNTAVIRALLEDNLVAVEALIQKGADTTIRNKEGRNLDDIRNRLGKSNPFIGQLEGYGDRDAPYQIELSSDFVAYTQYRPINPENNEELQNILESVPKPHIVYSCPSGHLHWSEACGVPTQVDRCGRDTTPEGGDGPCKMLVGGVHHFLCPGCYVVYHDGYSVSKIWFGDFPAYSYPKYIQLVGQYNMAVEWSKKEMSDLNIQYMVPIEEKMPEDVALKVNTKDYEEVIVNQGGCSICSSGLDETDAYYLMNCGHLMCEDCVRSARQGDLANISVGSEEDFAMRKCGVSNCGKRFHFGDPLQKIKLYKFAKHKKSSCVIS